jgi:hypothetical protein
MEKLSRAINHHRDDSLLVSVRYPYVKQSMANMDDLGNSFPKFSQAEELTI